VFLDVANITIQAGRGGDGCVSTRREKFVPRGGPDGGNGGRGGGVWLVADPEMGTLLDFRYRREYRAGDGKPGGGNRRTGADGQDLSIPVPCGTSVIELPDETLLVDLVEPDQRFLVAAGGAAGRGNWEFRSARNQTPRKATSGKPGQSLQVRLELRLIADIGLVGAPNAGKSTLLSALTAARPKVADYPFTTLAPNLGIVALSGYRSCTLADIPGLIEGASEGKGLGHAFLRHIERTAGLLLLTDGGNADPTRDLDILYRELRQHDRRLSALPFAVLVTKADLMDETTAAQRLAMAARWTEERDGRACLLISAVRGDGLGEMRGMLGRMMQSLRASLSACPRTDSDATADPARSDDEDEGEEIWRPRT
jgi:GTPase